MAHVEVAELVTAAQPAPSGRDGRQGWVTGLLGPDPSWVAVIGDSLARGCGGLLGVSDWATVACRVAAARVGQPDPGPGMVLGERDETLWGKLGWSTLNASTVAPVLFGGGRVLPAAGSWIGDTRNARRGVVAVARQAGGGSVEVSWNGGGSWTAPASSDGAGWLLVDSGDLGSVASRQVRVRRSGGPVTVGGWVPVTVTAGPTAVNVAKGGTTAAQWAADGSWVTLLSSLDTVGRGVSTVVVSCGGNDALTGVSVSAGEELVREVLRRVRLAVPRASVVLLIPPRSGNSVVPALSTAVWERWRVMWRRVSAGGVVVDCGGVLGDVSEGEDRWGVSSDSVGHPGTVGQRVVAWEVLDRLGLPPMGI